MQTESHPAFQTPPTDSVPEIADPLTRADAEPSVNEVRRHFAQVEVAPAITASHSQSALGSAPLRSDLELRQLPPPQVYEGLVAYSGAWSEIRDGIPRCESSPTESMTGSDSIPIAPNCWKLCFRNKVRVSPNPFPMQKHYEQCGTPSSGWRRRRWATWRIPWKLGTYLTTTSTQIGLDKMKGSGPRSSTASIFPPLNTLTRRSQWINSESSAPLQAAVR